LGNISTSSVVDRGASVPGAIYNSAGVLSKELIVADPSSTTPTLAVAAAARAPIAR
jgi:hypothetical protein